LPNCRTGNRNLPAFFARSNYERSRRFFSIDLFGDIEYFAPSLRKTKQFYEETTSGLSSNEFCKNSCLTARWHGRHKVVSQLERAPTNQKHTHGRAADFGPIALGQSESLTPLGFKVAEGFFYAQWRRFGSTHNDLYPVMMSSST
jgi:hypothetical protein